MHGLRYRIYGASCLLIRLLASCYTHPLIGTHQAEPGMGSVKQPAGMFLSCALRQLLMLILSHRLTNQVNPGAEH